MEAQTPGSAGVASAETAAGGSKLTARRRNVLANLRAPRAKPLPGPSEGSECTSKGVLQTLRGKKDFYSAESRPVGARSSLPVRVPYLSLSRLSCIQLDGVRGAVRANFQSHAFVQLSQCRVSGATWHTRDAGVTPLPVELVAARSTLSWEKSQPQKCRNLGDGSNVGRVEDGDRAPFAKTMGQIIRRDASSRSA